VEAFAAAAERDPLVLSLDPQFSNRWFSSRIPRLSAHPAGANLEIRVEERLADFLTDGVDLGVRYGRGRWPGVETAHLFQETMFPVCSPAFAERHPVESPADLLGVPLLRQRHQPWVAWFETFGLKAAEPKGVIFDDSLLLLDAAVQGLGVALARGSLAEMDVTAGRLVRPLEAAMPSPWGFYVVWRGDSRRLDHIFALRDWLLEETAERRAAWLGPVAGAPPTNPKLLI
jgi:LysR family glycine cleavage system transcriptional activator